MLQIHFLSNRWCHNKEPNCFCFLYIQNLTSVCRKLFSVNGFESNHLTVIGSICAVDHPFRQNPHYWLEIIDFRTIHFLASSFHLSWKATSSVQKWQEEPTFDTKNIKYSQRAPSFSSRIRLCDLFLLNCPPFSKSLRGWNHQGKFFVDPLIVIGV